MDTLSHHQSHQEGPEGERPTRSGDADNTHNAGDIPSLSRGATVNRLKSARTKRQSERAFTKTHRSIPHRRSTSSSSKSTEAPESRSEMSRLPVSQPSNTNMTESSERPMYTPTTHRISKAKKGRRVHGCTYADCGKVCVLSSTPFGVVLLFLPLFFFSCRGC
jgi:hypothetical protein